ETAPRAHGRGRVAQAHAESAPKRAYSEEDEHCRPEQPEDRLYRPDRQERRDPERSESRVGQIYERDPGREREPDRQAVPKRRLDLVQRDRAELQRDEEAEP